MTLDEAIAAITGTYPVDDKGEVADTIDITSGGKRTDRDVEPALFASRELAIEAWHREMMAALAVSAPAAIRFTDGPHVDKWNITVMDRRGTHRVSEPRWSVTARVGLIGHREAEMTDEFAKMIGERVEALTERVEALTARVTKLNASGAKLTDGSITKAVPAARLAAAIEGAFQLLARSFVISDGPVGGAYHTVTANGIKPEGQPRGDGIFAPEVAITEWTERVHGIACQQGWLPDALQKAALVFRKRPELDCDDSGLWHVTSRLLITAHQ